MYRRAFAAVHRRPESAEDLVARIRREATGKKNHVLAYSWVSPKQVLTAHNHLLAAGHGVRTVVVDRHGDRDVIVGHVTNVYHAENVPYTYGVIDFFWRREDALLSWWRGV
jgi:hypothetical protein